MKLENFPKDRPIIEDDDPIFDFGHIFSIILRVAASILSLLCVVLFIINIVNKEDVMYIYLYAYCFVLNIVSFIILYYLRDY